MRFTVAFPMFEASHLLPLAKVAEEVGFDSITLPDSVFFPEEVSAGYPYTPDGSRFWAPDTPFIDPFVAIPAMAAVTERIRFYTNVVKLPIRNPLLVAKQVASIAVLSGNRFALGVGLSWMPEEFTWTQTEKKTRGVRTDEMIEIIRAVCAGKGPEWVSYHGKHYDFDRFMISPAPDEPVPIYVGGHAEPSLRRAARLGNGWISVNVTTAEIAEAIGKLDAFRAELGRDREPFDISVLATDAFDLDGYRRLADLGVTHVQCVPWYFYGGDPESLDVRRSSFERFAEDVIRKF
ncbi:MAG: TIGR03619 family F420-dependent LLM class oxidoreductase [Actinomycetota bacterium]